MPDVNKDAPGDALHGQELEECEQEQGVISKAGLPGAQGIKEDQSSGKQMTEQHEPETEYPGDIVYSNDNGGDGDNAGQVDSDDKSFLNEDIPEHVSNHVTSLKRQIEETIHVWKQRTKRMRVELHLSLDEALDFVEDKLTEHATCLDELKEATLEKCLLDLANARGTLSRLGATVRASGEEIHCD